MVNPNRYIPLIYPCYPLIYPIHVDKTIITRYVIVHWFIGIPSWGYSNPQHWVQLGNIIPLKPFKTYSWCFQKPLLSLRLCRATCPDRSSAAAGRPRRRHSWATRRGAARLNWGLGWEKGGKILEKSWKVWWKCVKLVFFWIKSSTNLDKSWTNPHRCGWKCGKISI